MLLSNIPMRLAGAASRRLDRAGVTLWLAVCSVFGLAFLAVRGFEFAALNTRWDSDAYGSIAWTTVGFHALLIVLEVGETLGALALFLVGPVSEKHYVDTSDNALYWVFVTVSWVPLYVVIYLLPYWT
jgi:cytochrome c oxidase subunit 1/cytochrome c oxidase subunit I+III